MPEKVDFIDFDGPAFPKDSVDAAWLWVLVMYGFSEKERLVASGQIYRSVP